VPIGYVALRAAPIRVAKKGKARLTLTPEASGASTSPGVQHPETTDKA
jgi:hypothetical protein